MIQPSDDLIIIYRKLGPIHKTKPYPLSISQLNALNKADLEERLTRCCGSTAWVKKIATVFPVNNEQELFQKAEETWFQCTENDWREAFTHHPQIGDVNALRQKFASTVDWAENEQLGVKQSSGDIMEALANGNRLYREKFGYIFIVCATGKSADEMLSLLNTRLNNRPAEEIRVAMNEQNQITLLRLNKLLAS